MKRPHYNKDLDVRIVGAEDLTQARQVAGRAYGMHCEDWYRMETILGDSIVLGHWFASSISNRNRCGGVAHRFLPQLSSVWLPIPSIRGAVTLEGSWCKLSTIYENGDVIFVHYGLLPSGGTVNLVGSAPDPS